MISDHARLLGALLVLVGACAADVPVIELDGVARRAVTLWPPVDGDLTSHRWELIAAPAGSQNRRPQVDTPIATFTPDMRGVYLIDHWVVSGLAEDLAHHFVVTAAGLAPTAVVLGNADVIAGGTAQLDGQRSKSEEGLALSYRWRLTARPAASQVTLPSADQVQVQVTTDVPGDYVLELAVFDGELWSSIPATGTVRAAAPP